MKTQKRSPFAEYFANVWAGTVTTLVGMRLTLGYFFRKPVTIQYPEVKAPIPENYRGIHGYDEEKCLVCKACAAACPVDCITIEQVGRGKDAMCTTFDIDYAKCLFCGLCTAPCPTECLFMTKEYDLARYTREECLVHFARPKTPEEIAAHMELLARKEAEKKAKDEAAKAAAASVKAEGAKPGTQAQPAAASLQKTA